MSASEIESLSSYSRATYRTRGGESSRLAADRRAPARGALALPTPINKSMSMSKAPHRSHCRVLHHPDGRYHQRWLPTRGTHLMPQMARGRMSKPLQ